MILSCDVERLAGLGWHLFPRSCRTRHAAFPGASEAATTSLGQLSQWSHDHPGCGWCAMTGSSGIWCLDVDVAGPDHAGDGVTLLRQLVERHGPIPPRPTVRSGGGGLLLVFAYHGEPIVGRSAALGAGLDPKRGRQSITVPPTQHHRTGAAYRWIVPPWEVEPPEAPAWLLKLLEPPAAPSRPYTPPATWEHAVQVVYRACDRIFAARPGERNDTLNRAAWPVARAVALGKLEERNAESVLVQAATHIGLPEMEARQTIRSAFRAARRKVW